MHIFDFVSVKLTFFLIFGIVLGFYLEPTLIPIFSLFILCLLFLGFAWKIHRFFEVAAVAITGCLGILITILALGGAHPNHYSKLDVDKEGLWELKTTKVLKSSSYQQRYQVEVNSFERRTCTGKLILNVSKDSLLDSSQVDDKIVVLAKLEQIQPPLNPHQFDYKDYLKKQGIHHKISVHPQAIIQKNKASKTFYGHAMEMRERIIQNLSKERFGKEEFGVIQALLLGKRDNISEDTYTDYKNAGAVHILAVSGLHVGVLLLLFQFLLKPLTYLPKGETIRLCTVVVLLWGYAFLAGLSPSVVRAVTMFSFLAYAQYLNRPTNSFNIIALSMFFILLVNPLVLFQVGFQMSYAAVFFIVWIYPKLQRFWYPNHYLVRKVWQLLSVSLAAQLGVLPISLFYFHQFPALFFVSNLLIIPFLGVILGVGILTMTLSFVNLLPEILVVGFNFIIKIMNEIISWVAHQEGFVLKEIPMDGIQMLLLYGIIISMVLFLSKPKFKMAIALSFGIVGLQLLDITREYRGTRQNAFLIPHSPKTSVLLHKNGRQLKCHAIDSMEIKSMTTQIKIGEQLRSAHYQPLENAFQIQKQRIYRVDSLAIFPSKQQIDIIWLSQSPKINLERWLDSLEPKKVIADGTNYINYVRRWRRTCQNKKVPFHDTREKGAYQFD